MELELLEVVQRQHRPLLLLEAHDRFAQDRDFLFLPQLLVDGVVRIRVEQIEQRRLRLTALVGGAVDRDADRAFDVRLPLPQCLNVHAERLRDFGIFRRAADARGHGGAGGLDVAGLAAHGPRHVVLPAQLVEDRAANSRHGERAERESALRVERAHGGHETERSGAH